MVAHYAEKSMVSAEEIQAHLNTFLGTTESASRQRSADFLKKFGDDDTVRRLDAEFESLAGDLRRMVLDILLVLGTDYALRRLVARVFEGSSAERRDWIELIRDRVLYLFSPLVEQRKAMGRQPALQSEIHLLIVSAGYFNKLKMLLTHGNDRVVLYGLRQAYRYPSPEVYEMVRPLLTSRNWQVRYNSIMVMTRLNMDSAREFVVAALNDSIERIREAAVAHISLHIDEYRPRIHEMLKTSPDSLILTLLAVVGAGGDVEFLPQLVELAGRDDEKIAPKAVEAAVGVCSRLVQEDGMDETSTGFIVISRCLIDLTSREFNKTVTHQIRQLVRLGGVQALKLLLLHPSGGGVVEKSITARYIQGIDSFFNETVFHTLSSEGEDVFARYLRVMVFFYGQAGYDMIYRNLSGMDGERLRISGETLLSMRTDPAAVRDAFRQFTNSAQEDIRLAAYQVLAACGGTDLLPVLRREIDTGAAERVRTAIVALAAFRGKEALQLLIDIFHRPGYESWQEIILEAISGRRDAELLDTLLQLLSSEDESSRPPVAQRVGQLIQRMASVPESATQPEEKLAIVVEVLTHSTPREVDMLRQWVEYSRKGGVELLEHVRACLRLPPSTWPLELVNVAFFLVAQPLFSALEVALTDPGRGNMERALEVLRRADLMRVFRYYFADLLEGGMPDSRRLLQRQATGRPGLGAGLAVALFQGDGGLRLALLDALDDRLLPPLGPVLQWLARHETEDQVVAERSLDWLGRLRSSEAMEFLVNISGDRAHPMSEKARLMLEETREGELL